MSVDDADEQTAAVTVMSACVTTPSHLRGPSDEKDRRKRRMCIDQGRIKIRRSLTWLKISRKAHNALALAQARFTHDSDNTSK